MDLLYEQYIFHGCPLEMKLNTRKPDVYNNMGLSTRKKTFWLDFSLKIFFLYIDSAVCQSFLYDVTLTQLQESMKAVVLSASLLLDIFFYLESMDLGLLVKARVLPQFLLSAIPFTGRFTSFPNTDFINQRHAM